jgi:hypothetical protein
MAKYMVVGEFEHYHGEAINPRHLSTWERYEAAAAAAAAAVRYSSVPASDRLIRPGPVESLYVQHMPVSMPPVV